MKQGLDNAAQKLAAGRAEDVAALRPLAAVGGRSAAESGRGDAVDGRRARRPAGGELRSATRPTRSIAPRRRWRAIARKRTRRSSATGFAEMMQQLQEMAKKQGSINAQAQGLMPGHGPADVVADAGDGARAGARAAAGRAAARRVGRSRRRRSRRAVGEGSEAARRRARGRTSRCDDARAAAAALPSTARRRPLARRKTSARTRTSARRRRRRAATSSSRTTRTRPARRRRKFREPTWDELRGLSADERRAILEYFKRINAGTP